jgi:nucleoside-diphosphate kinase
MSQRTLVLLKPDTVRRGLVGEVLGRFEAKGLRIVALDQRTIDAELADQHYAEHVERDFYPPLREFVTSGPLIALVLEGDEAVEVVRALNGATDGRKAAPGTIRGDLSLSNRENLVHGSDSEESAAREIKIWFPDLPCSERAGGRRRRVVRKRIRYVPGGRVVSVRWLGAGGV